MPAKVSVPQLSVAFVYAVKIEKQPNMFTGRLVDVEVPQGVYHIFEQTITHYPRVKGEKSKVIEMSAFSMCGVEAAEIGKTCRTSDKAPHQNVCPKCAEKYKAHPRSPWRTFVTGEGIKV